MISTLLMNDNNNDAINPDDNGKTNDNNNKDNNNKEITIRTVNMGMASQHAMSNPIYYIHR